MHIAEVVGVTEVDDEVSFLEEDHLAELARQHLGIHLGVEVVLLSLLLHLGVLWCLSGEY